MNLLTFEEVPARSAASHASGADAVAEHGARHSGRAGVSVGPMRWQRGRPRTRTSWVHESRADTSKTEWSDGGMEPRIDRGVAERGVMGGRWGDGFQPMTPSPAGLGFPNPCEG